MRHIPQLKSFGILSLFTLFAFVLLAFRIAYADNISYIFLVWNLFLAWIPYWISLVIPYLDKKFNSLILSTSLLLAWLFFFPNAPYIFTDLFHLKDSPPLPLWFDLCLILSFAWTGLMLGYYSLINVQSLVKKRFSTKWSWFFVHCSLILCGFGIYLGRYQRWNTWDILNNPMALFLDISDKLLHPLQHMNTLGIAVVFSIFLILAYLSIRLQPRETN